MTADIMSKKLNAVVPDELWEQLGIIAEGEMRTKSQMTAILLAEAIAARQAAKAEEPDPPQPRGKRGKG